ncbi:MAG: hypothetical protein RR263_00610 [Oscillospiraceae bacterium]
MGYFSRQRATEEEAERERMSYRHLLPQLYEQQQKAYLTQATEKTVPTYGGKGGNFRPPPPLLQQTKLPPPPLLKPTANPLAMTAVNPIGNASLDISNKLLNLYENERNQSRQRYDHLKTQGYSDMAIVGILSRETSKDKKRCKFN